MRFDRRQMQIMLFILICMLLYTGFYIQKNNTANTAPGIIRFHVLANSNSPQDQELKLKVRDGVLEAVNQKLIKETMQKYDSVEPQEQNIKPEETTESEEGDSINTMAGLYDEATAQVSLNVDESREYLKDNLDLIEEIAENIIKENGYKYGVTAELGVRWIPEKTYGDMTFPAGNYEALNITIGAGEGNNWWCVLFPPLCLIDGSDNPNKPEPFTPATYAAIGMTDELMILRQNNKEDVSTQTAIKLKFKTLELLQK